MGAKYYDWHPLDGGLLERLPAEGSTVGYQVIAATVKRLTASLNEDVPEEGRVTTSQVHGRLRAMYVAGLVTNVTVMGSGGSKGWQRTRKGELRYAEATGTTLGPVFRKNDENVSAETDDVDHLKEGQ